MRDIDTDAQGRKINLAHLCAIESATGIMFTGKEPGLAAQLDVMKEIEKELPNDATIADFAAAYCLRLMARRLLKR